MTKSTEERLLELYFANLDIIGDGFPLSLNSKRRDYLESFNLIGLPSKKDEAYRHTPIKGIFEQEWENYFIPTETPNNLPCEGDCECCIKVSNGFLGEDYRWLQMDNGVAIGSIKSALQHMPEVVLSHLNSMAQNDTEPLTALNSAFMQDCVFVFIPKGTKVERSICIEYNYSTKDQQVMSFARMLVVAEDGVDAKISVLHKNREGSFMVNFVKEVYVGDSATVELTEFSDMNCNSVLFNNSYSSQKKQSKLSGVNIWLGGSVTRYNGVGEFDSTESENKFYGLYVSEGEQVFDINTYMNHKVSDCSSYQQVKGIAGGSSVGSFTGRVYVATDAQRSDAVQQSKNLLMGSDARVYAEPQLEIYADDVKCSHGATVGQINDDSIYYMRQRGLSEANARKLLMHGYINDIIMHCSIEHVCDEIVSSVDRIVDRF